MFSRLTILATGIIKKMSKEEFVSHNSKAFSIFSTKDNYTQNITHNIESTAVGNLQCERWGPVWFKRKSTSKIRTVQVAITTTTTTSNNNNNNNKS